MKGKVMKYIEAIAVGSAVVVGTDIPGLVTGILIDSDGLQYKVAWWAGSERKSEWLTAAEVRNESETASRIGFRVVPLSTEKVSQ
jgi:hypothetical protein